ncbi:MAG: FAD-dependent monooxygenase, partial [Acidimicrobiales bacterium]
MRISICGAGPGGLYFAILMMRPNPRNEITVFERNPPGATYGWGVVFSDESLADLRDADYETYLAIDDALVRWNAIDAHYGGERIRSVGHGFAAIARTELLRLLSERAVDLGVEVRYEHPVDDGGAVAALEAGCDLLVGADGVRSIIRTTDQAHFGTTFSPHRSRYVWFGTDQALPVFTFIFQPTRHGLFQVHSYPFDATSSTFIVECTEATWRRAGLDAQTETESVAFCQELFAEYLDDHKLLSNRSTWTTFVTLRNRAWHHGHTVLVGDAAHTAHFSIGSGTRLALDDAIALAKAFVAHPTDLAAAFAEYEGERQPVVERFQQVATDSSRYFESVRRYLGFAPEQFAFNLLTRSGRIGHLELERRDPALVNRVDRWFAGQPGRVVAPPPRLTPFHLGETCTLPNRVVMVGGEGAAAAGAGLVVTEPVAPSPEGRIAPDSAGIWNDHQATAWAETVARVHDLGARIAVRLTHAGRRAATVPRQRGLDRPLPPGQAWPILSASPLPYTPFSQRPRHLDRATMDEVVQAHSAAAGRAREAGFDVLLLD